jgi:shikimate 5-dehydrogenase
MSDTTVSIAIGPKTKYIISTSGRISSLKRYQKLLQRLLKLDIAYLPIHSGDEENPAIDPVRFVSTLKGFPCIGGAISRDIKQAILPYIDELDESAKLVQSVNTVIVKDKNRLIGYNTDALGFREAIENGIRVSGIAIKSAVCYGYGGVASVVVNILQSMGIEVFITGRRHEIATQRASELHCSVWTNESIDLFVNATPASEKPLDQATNLLESLSSAKIVFDHEMPGRYLQEHCVTHGKYLIQGTEMYYPQMRVQWALFLQGLVDPALIPELLQQADQPDQ